MNVGADGRDGRDDTVWIADEIGRRDRMWNRVYMIPVIAGTVGLSVVGLAKLVGLAPVAWPAGGVAGLVLLACLVYSDRRVARHGIVEIRLGPGAAPTHVKLRRADGELTTHPLGELNRVTIVRDDITRPYVIVHLRLTTGEVHTRAGADVMPTALIAALRRAGVEVRIVD